MEFGQNKIIDLFDARVFVFGLDFFKYYGPLCDFSFEANSVMSQKLHFLRILEHCVNFDVIRPANNIIDNNAGVCLNVVIRLHLSIVWSPLSTLLCQENFVLHEWILIKMSCSTNAVILNIVIPPGRDVIYSVWLLFWKLIGYL